MDPPSARPSPTSDRSLQGAARLTVVLALMLMLLLEALDQTIVGTAMPRIIGQLHGLDRYTWAVTAYLLASTTLIPIAAKLSDQFGRKRFLLGGTALFLAGSASCGAAQTIDQLIVCRAIQGAGAGIGIALVFTTVGDLFPPAERGRWTGIVNSVYGISSVIGPTVGGWLADHGPLLGSLVTAASRWRWVFYINLPLGLIAMVALALQLPANVSVRSSAHTGWAAARRIDAAGAALAAVATLCLLLGLTWGGAGTSSWGEPRVVGALLGAAVLYAVLLVVERGAVEPILPLSLFRHGAFAATAALSLLLNMALLGMAFYAPLYLQGVLGVTATGAGAAMTPFSVGIAVASSLGGVAITALGRYQGIAILGALLMTVGTVLLTPLLPQAGLVQAVIAVGIAGAGMGAIFAAVGVATLNALPPTHLGAGMGAVRYLGQLGGAVGAAVVGAAVNVSLANELGRHLAVRAVRALASYGVTVPANPQVLVSLTYRESITRAALRSVARHIPPGPRHAALAAATRHMEQLLSQAFAALRHSLALAIQHGMLVVLALCGAAMLAACFVKDT